MNRVPAWAGAIALSCMLLLVGAWGANMASAVKDNAKCIAETREESAEVRARLTALEEQIREMRTELHAVLQNMTSYEKGASR